MISCQIFLHRSTVKLRTVTVLCCVPEIFRLRRSLWITEGAGEGENSAIFHRKILSQNAEKFRRETLLCFINFQIDKKIPYKMEAGITIFRQNCFVSQYLKFF